MSSTANDVDVCAVCDVSAAQRCANCRTVRYCSKAHQRAHWKNGHKVACHPYAITTTSVLGRHWVATRDIAAGELLLEEQPLAVGPKSGSPPVCLTCYAPANGHKCAACGWPVCGSQCETASVHRLAECPLIAGHYDPYRSAVYCFVLPLRCLLLDDLNGGRRTKFWSLQSHIDIRLDTPLYRAYAVNVAAFVLDRLGLRSTGKHDDRSALEAAAILDTNAFEVRRPGGRQFRAVYAQASMIAHSCTPNTKHVFVGDDTDGQPAIRILASMPIVCGQPVTATYTQTLWCTRDRRRHLSAAKCFECTCPRCDDPTELGTHLGSLACTECDTGRATATAADFWRCTSCGREANGADAVAEAERRIRLLSKTDFAGFELFLEQVYAGTKRPFHANHYTVVGVKYALAQLYGDRISG